MAATIKQLADAAKTFKAGKQIAVEKLEERQQSLRKVLDQYLEGVKASDFAKEVGISEPYLSQIRNGKADFSDGLVDALVTLDKGVR